MLQYLHHLKLAFSPSDQANSSKLHNPGEDESPDVRLILGGYSYGSLIASHVPSLEVMLDIFRFGPTSTSASTHKPTPKSEICKASMRIATSTLEKFQMTHSHSLADINPTALTTSISYLLVSPLLPPISHLLTSFSTLSLNVKADTGSDTRIPCRPADRQSTHHTLALFGDQDAFTSAGKLERWSDEMAHMPRSQFQFRKIDGAGHFWREDGVEMRARHALKVWLGQI
jgi:alpha/beta superfamily hydrolase